MSFAAALALLVGLFVAAPVVAHLLRRRKTDVFDFPPAKLVAAAPPIARRRSRLEDRALFGIRAMAIVALALLGATPLLHCSKLALGRRGGGSLAVLLVVDDSMSMRAKLGSSTRLKRAVQGGHEVLDSLRDGDAVAIVAAGSPARIVLAATTDIGSARRTLDAMKETDRATDLEGALTLAGSLGRALAQPDRRIVLLSDLADGHQDGPPIGTGVDIPLWAPLSELRVRAPDCGVVRATRRLAEVHVTIACGAAEDASARPLEIVDKNAVIASTMLSKQSSQELTIDLPKGDFGPLLARLGGTDSIASDDVAPVVPAGGALQIAVVADISQSGMVNGGASPVEQALAALDETVSVRPLPTVPDNTEDLAAYSAIVLDDPPGLTPEARAALRTWTEKGGVSLLLLGPRAGTAVLGAAAFDPFVTGTVRWLTPAPGGADPKSAPSLGAAADGLVTLAAKGRATVDAHALDGSTVLAKWSDGAPLLFVHSLGRGTMLVGTLPGSLESSDFPLRPAFLDILQRTVDAGRARALASRSVVGAPWQFHDAAPTAITGPGGPLLLRSESGARVASPDLAGLYTLAHAEGAETRVAEIDPREVDLRPRAALPEATSESLGSHAAALDVSPYVAFLLLAAIAGEAALRLATERRDALRKA